MTALLIRLKGYLIAVGAALAFIAAIFLRGKAAGKQEAKQKQSEADNEARERMGAVRPMDDAGTIERLRSGKF